jgi:hypothetical protein
VEQEEQDHQIQYQDLKYFMLEVVELVLVLQQH